jgi:dihydroorotase
MIEVTPQHLYYDIPQIPEEDLVGFQMNPPIRQEEDRLCMLEALKAGEIDFLATDHAPHTPEEKRAGTSGLTGLDTYSGFVTWLLKDGIDPKIIATVASENPGKFFNHFVPGWALLSPVFKEMGKGVGFLEEGYRANFTILNLNKPYTVLKENLKTKCGLSPFLNVTFPGQLEALFIGGKKV